MRALALFLCVCTGCAGMDESIRTERGPKLREFDRPRVVEGGVSGRVSVVDPAAAPGTLQLKLELEGYDTCRTERVEEFAEDKIHEHRGSGAGAALSLGLAFTVASAVLFGASFVLSHEPNKNRIDGAGNYGAPPFLTARGWSIGLVCIGLPALVVGVVQSLRTGEDVETVKVEQIASQRDETCNVRAIDGPIYVRGEDDTAVGPSPTAGGTLTFDEKKLPAAVDGFYFYEREVVLDDASKTLLIAFNGCSRIDREALAEPSALSTGALLKRLEAVRACRQIRGDVLNAEQQRLEADLARRREGGESGTFLPGAKRLASFEEAVSAYPPRFTLQDGSPDLAKSLEQLTSQNVLVRGRVQAGLSPNIGVVAYADREVFVFLPPDAKWASDDFSLGTPVELIGIVSGLQTVGDRTAPLVRAMWMRKVP